MNISKEKQAIKYLQSFEPHDEPYYLCYSGGKDSDAIRILASLAGVKHDIENNHTTVDAPETVRYIRSIPNVHINYPEKSMWDLIVQKKIPPTRLVRYCCEELKEHGGAGRVKITGVRWEESAKRAESAGLVSIIGKPKTVQKVAEESGAKFSVNKFRGGGTQYRQCRVSQGLDIRLLNDADISDLNDMRIHKLHFAWDNPAERLEEHFKRYASQAKHKPHGHYGMVYCLTNFNSTMEENIYRIYTLRDMGYDPYVMIYDKTNAPKEIKRLQRWCNNKFVFRSCKRFEDYKR